MNDLYRFRKTLVRSRIRQLIKEAASAKHERIVEKLELFAVGLGFKKKQNSLNSGRRPDVLRMEGQKLLFIGDAKVADNETPSKKETATRIRNYVYEFSAMLDQGEIEGGIIAIATDKLVAAKQWKQFLNKLAKWCDLMDGDRNPPDFQIKKLDTKIWCVFW